MRRIKSLATLLLMGIPAWVVMAGVFGLEQTSILVHVDEPGVTVWVDDFPAEALTGEVGPFDVKPGEYRVRVTRDGIPVFSRAVSVEPGECVEVWAHWTARESASTARPVPPIAAVERAQEGHFATVTGLGASGDGRRLISVGADGTLRAWDPATGEALATVPAHVGTVSGLTLLADGRSAVTAGDDGTVGLWDIDSGTTRFRFHSGTDSALRCSAATPDGRLAAVGLVSGLVQVFDLRTGEELVRHSVLPAGAAALAFTPDGRSLVVSMIGSTPRTHRVEVWDAATGAVKRTLEGHAGPAWCVAVLPDGRRALTGGSDRTLRVWDLEQGREVDRLTDHPGAVFSVAVSADGTRALAGTSHLWDGGGWTDAESYGVVVWDLGAGKAVGRFETAGPVRAVAISPDGRRVFSGGEDRIVRTWELSNSVGLACEIATSDREVLAE